MTDHEIRNCEKDCRCWVVKLCPRTNESKWLFIDHDGCLNSRLSSAQRYEKAVAVQYAYAITMQHPKYMAIARRIYADGRLWHRPEQHAVKENHPDPVVQAGPTVEAAAVEPTVSSANEAEVKGNG